MQILKTVILDDTVTSEQCHIDIVDDLDCEPNERFYISLIILNGNCAAENNGSIPVTILDDGELEPCIGTCIYIRAQLCVFYLI